MHIAYRHDIDGLRAVAVLSVILFHAFPNLLPGGFVGVDIFFVISGYLITKGVLNDLEADRFSLLVFYQKRARRILPALVLVLLGCIGYGLVELRPFALLQLGRHVAAASLFSSNLLLWGESGYFDTSSLTKPLLHLWSLGIEEQFYILWPLALMAIGSRRGLRIATVAAVICLSFAYSEYAVTNNPTAAFYSPVSRAWELGIGAIVAMMPALGITRQRWTAEIETVVGVGLIAASMTWLDQKAPFPGALAAPCVFGAALCVYSGGRSFVGRHVLGNPAFVAIGLISYPLYLWHWPLVAFANIRTENQIPPAQMMALMAASLILATATYLFLERPIRRLPGWNRFSPLAATASLVAIGAMGVAVYLEKGIPARYPIEIRPILAIDLLDPRPAGRHPDCWVWAETPVSKFGSECYFSQTSDAPKIMIWGDSHAAMLYTGMKTYFGDMANLAQFTRNACPPLLGFPGYCGEANRGVLDIARKTRPDVLVLFGAWANYHDYSYGYDQANDFRTTLAEIKKAGISHIVVVGPAPFWDPDLPTLAYRDWVTSSPHELPDRVPEGSAATVRNWDAILASESARLGVQYFSALDFFCDQNGCRTHTEQSKSALIAWDSGHFTTPGATEVIKAIDARFGLVQTGEHFPAVAASDRPLISQ